MLRLSKRTFTLILVLLFLIIFGGIAVFVFNYIQSRNVSPDNPGASAIGTDGGIGVRVANQGDYQSSINLNPGEQVQVQVQAKGITDTTALYNIGFYNLDNEFPTTGGCQGTPRPAGIPTSEPDIRTNLIINNGTQLDCGSTTTLKKTGANASLVSIDTSTGMNIATYNYTFNYNQLCQIDSNNSSYLRRVQINMAYDQTGLSGGGRVTAAVNLVNCGATTTATTTTPAPSCGPTSENGNPCRVQYYTNASNQNCFKIFGLDDCKVLNGRDTDFRYIYQVNNPGVSTCSEGVGVGTNNGFVLPGQDGAIVEGTEYCAVDKGYTCTQVDFNFDVRYSVDVGGNVTNCPTNGSLSAGGTCSCTFTNTTTTTATATTAIPTCDLSSCNARSIQCFNSGDKVVKCDANSDCQSTDPNCVNGHWATANYTCNSQCALIPKTTTTTATNTTTTNTTANTTTAPTCVGVTYYNESSQSKISGNTIDMQCGQSVVFSMDPGTIPGLTSTGENAINNNKWTQISTDTKGTFYGQNTNYGGVFKYVANANVTGNASLSIANMQGTLTCTAAPVTVNIACTQTPKVYPTAKIVATGGTCTNRNVTLSLQDVTVGSGTFTDKSIVIINKDAQAFGSPVACPIALRSGNTYSGVAFSACDYVNVDTATWTPPSTGGTFQIFVRARNSDNLACNGNPLNTAADLTSYDPDVMRCSAQDSVTVTIPSVASCNPTYPDLIIKKTEKDNKQVVHPGDTITYTIKVQNIGDGSTSSTQGITVRDTLPSTLTVNSVSGTGWACTSAISCTTNAVLAKNQFANDITVVATVSANAIGSIVNNANVMGGGERDQEYTGANTPDSGNNSDNNDNFDKWTITITQSPVDGSCGAANGSTTGTCGQAPVGSLCASGNADRTVTLPVNGGSVAWKCVGLNGSTVTKDCSASCTKSITTLTTTAKTITATVTTCGKDGCLPNTSLDGNMTFIMLIAGGLILISGYLSYRYYMNREFNYKNRKEIFES